MKSEREDNILRFNGNQYRETDENALETKRRILAEMRRRRNRTGGRPTSGRVTGYLLQTLRSEGREKEAQILMPFMSTAMKKTEAHPKIEYTSETKAIQRYKARKEREREARAILRGQADKTRAERNEEVRFCVSGEILQRAEAVALESGLSVGEMLRVILASMTGVGIEQRMGPAQATFPFWKLNGKI